MKYTGLSSDEVSKLRSQFGANIITSSHKTTALGIFLKQLKSPLIYILIFAAILSVVLKENKDAMFILVVVFINTALGFYQEYKAENTLEKLRSRVSSYIKVFRDGVKKEITAQELVPGDIIMLESGLKVPGDGYLLEATELMVNESLITGESEPIEKRAAKNEEESEKDSCQIKMGSVVVQGLGIAKIVKTGNYTFYGKIAEKLTENIDPETPTKQKLGQITKFITYLIGVVVIIILALGFYRELEPKELILTAVAIAVSVIPEGLVVSFTIVLALGMNRIMAKKSIVKNLPAAETLGSIDVLCVDKTGTLTYGEMRVDEVDFSDTDAAYKCIIMCNNSSNFIDRALEEYVIGEKSSEVWNKIQNNRKNIFPFSSKFKYTGAYDDEYLYAIGAPEVILSFSSENKKFEDDLTEKAKKGFRILGLARKKLVNQSDVSRDDFKDMEFLGFIYVTDPVRETAKTSLERILNAGIDVKIITGDMKETTMSVLNQLDINIPEDEIFSGEEIGKVLDENEFDEITKKAKLFYRTTPEQKLLIVKSFQRQNKKVAMMGDGINDSPALKNAEIGISVDTATDVSKEVSDLVLLDSNFQTIIDAIEEGRNIFHNFRKIFVYLFGDSLSEVVLIVFTLLFGIGHLPLLPIQILWINLIVDGFPSIALGFDKPGKSLLTKKEKPTNLGIFDRATLTTIMIVSLVTDIMYFLFFKYLLDSTGAPEYAQTMTFTGISISSLLFLFSAKTIETNIWKENIFNNNFLNLSVIFGFIMIIAGIYFEPFANLLSTIRLSPSDFGLVLIVSILNIMIIEFVKMVAHRKTS